MLLLLLPLVTAAEGRFSAEGAVELPAQAAARIEGEAIFLNRTDELEALLVRAPNVHVHVVKATYPAVTVSGVASVGGPGSFERAQYPLTGVEVSLRAGSVPGIVGIYPGRASETTIASGRGITLTPVAALQLGDAPTDDAADGAPDSPAYGRALGGPIFDVWASGELGFTGAGVLKLAGPSVVVRANENSTAFETGRRYDRTRPVDVIVETWVVLTFEEVTLTLEHPLFEIAGGRATFEWEGAASIGRMSGEMRTADALYEAKGERVQIIGRFAAEARATSGPDGRAVAFVTAEGDLHATSLRPSSREVTPAPAWRPLGLGVLVLVSVAVGVTGAVLYGQRRARPAQELSVEQYRDLADAAMENLRFADALGWIEKAQALAPGSARLWMDRGTCHAALADVREALHAYERAAELSTDGEADLLAASLLMRAGATDLDAAERHVERALARSPAMAIEVQLDSAFDPLRGRPRFNRVVRRALGDRQA